MVLRPGDEIFQYSMSWSEPFLFDTDNSLRVSGSYRQREFSSSGRVLYDEERLTLPAISVGRRLGEFWDISLNSRIERAKLKDIAPNAPVDAFEAAGPDTMVGLGFSLTRSSVKTITRPGEGSRLSLRFENVGLAGGDIDFTSISGEYTVFLTLHRDFLGRASILKVNTRAGYIFEGDAPLYERFYLGGRSLRGFDFRTVSPKGVDRNGNLTTDPVGGDWLFFAGLQYEVPLVAENLTGVVFLDSGTVTNDPGFDDYRASVGIGIRIYIPQFGPIPIALDIATPLADQPGDDKQVFSFSAELPF
jgi:outer membrane protein insertion porin family